MIKEGKNMEKVLQLSKQLWEAMHDENIDFLKENIHTDAVFVHMGVTLNRDDELDVIQNKKIVYKNIDIENTSVRQLQSTVVVLTKLKLTAVVDGNEVVNPFVVTEVYTKNDNEVKLASLSYTRINY